MQGIPGPPLVNGRTSRSDFLTWFSFVLFAFYSEFSRLPHFDSRRLESRLTEVYWITLSVSLKSSVKAWLDIVVMLKSWKSIAIGSIEAN